MRMEKVLLSLGSNLGESLDIIKNACNDIKADNDIQEVIISSYYQTKPVGYKDQDDFINIAISLTTTKTPYQMLDLCAFLEQKYQRVRLFKNGPRTLDVDIIAFGEVILDEEKLILPHPRMHQRAFVLAPLKEIEPNFVITKYQKSISQLYDLLDDTEKQGVKIIHG